MNARKRAPTFLLIPFELFFWYILNVASCGVPTAGKAWIANNTMQPFPPDPLTSRFEFNSSVPQHSAQPTTLWRKRLFGSTGKYQNLPNLGSTKENVCPFQDFVFALAFAAWISPLYLSTSKAMLPMKLSKLTLLIKALSGNSLNISKLFRFVMLLVRIL